MVRPYYTLICCMARLFARTDGVAATMGLRITYIRRKITTCLFVTGNRVPRVPGNIRLTC